MNDMTRWLEWLYGPEPDGLLWIGGHGDRFAGRTFTSISDAVAYATQLDEQAAGGVYHRLTTMRPVERGRGAAADSAYLPAFAMDLDLKGPGHKALNYPETELELIALLRKAGLPDPSAWVHSGGGRYPVWKLEQAADLTLPGALEQAASTSAALHRLVIETAADAGLKVDNTSDLARVFRLPGTHNRKTGEPIACTFQIAPPGTQARFEITELTEHVSRAARPAAIKPRARALPAAAGSPFMTTAGAALFGQQTGERSFTLTEAMAYVQPFLDALRTAHDGEINNRLNDAALTMAHFGPEFWDLEAASGQLMSALSATDYDGATWQAETTITSAYNAMSTKIGPEFWQAVRTADLSPPVIPETEVGSKADWLERQLVSADELADLPAPIPLIYGLLDKNTETWLIGEPGSFKSFIALDLAAHIGSGTPWQGHRVRKERVLYIAAEGAGGMTLRTRAWRTRHGVMEGVDFLPLPLQVNRPDEWSALVEVAARRDYGFIVIDTQARVTKGLDENTAKDAGVFIDAVTALRMAQGACVFVVHHTGRDGKNARGSSAIDGAQDTEFKLSRCTPRSDMKVIFKEDKQKDMAEDDGITLKLAVVDLGQDPETGRSLSSLVVLDQDAWRDAADGTAATAETAASSVRVNEPGAWTLRLVPQAGAEYVVRRQILQTLLDVAGRAEGRTQAEIRRSVDERWYSEVGTKPARKRTGVDSQTWNRSWTACLELVDPASGELVVTAGSSAARKIIHPDTDVTGE